jgi:hypothetical protein
LPPVGAGLHEVRPVLPCVVDPVRDLVGLQDPLLRRPQEVPQIRPVGRRSSQSSTSPSARITGIPSWTGATVPLASVVRTVKLRTVNPSLDHASQSPASGSGPPSGGWKWWGTFRPEGRSCHSKKPETGTTARRHR